MAHFAKIVDGVVEAVIVADQSFIDTLEGTWVQTSYNTYGGVHRAGGVPLRKNYAGIGYSYDESRDAFISQKPFASWILNEESCLWKPPVDYPTDGREYQWNEDSLSWVELT